MNWYKKAQQAPMQFSGWSKEPISGMGKMSILWKGKRYIYQDISREEANYISKLIGHKNYSVASKTLRSYSDRYKRKIERQNLTSRGYLPEEEQEMLNEFEEEGILSPKKDISQ